jgi:hypothetical protein
VPAGLLVVVAGAEPAVLERQDGGRCAGPAAVCVWHVETDRPSWAVER